MEKYNLTQTGEEVQRILDESTPQSDLNAEIERAQGAEQTIGEGVQQNANDIDAIEEKIPSGASSSNKLTDKEYVDGLVGDEATAREQADTALDGKIDDEETRAKAAEKQNADDIDALEALVPTGASSSNKLATESYVNDAVATGSATFRGTYNLVSDLHLTLDATHGNVANALASVIDTADNNDFAFVLIPTDVETPTVIGSIDRYKFNGEVWAYEYTLNNSGFTQEQWDAINSGITSGDVTKLSALPTNAELTLLLNGLQGDIDDEEVRAKAAELALQGAIDDEETRAKAAEKANADDIDAIEEKIPSGASSENKLATESYVNDAVATNTATFRGTYNLVSDLHLTLEATHANVATALSGAIGTADNNDFAFVLIPTDVETPTVIGSIDRYKFNGSVWSYEYTLNNSGFTQAQWDSINSGITSGDVTKLSALPTNAELTLLLNGLQGDIDDEEVRAKAAELALQGAIDDEEIRAKAAEKQNADDIDAIEEKIPSSASSSNKLATASDVDSLSAAIEAILLLIPTAASSLNQLADKAFVNSSIATSTATFRGTFNLVSDLGLTILATHAQIETALSGAIPAADNNDYCFVQIPTSIDTPTEIAKTERYKYNGYEWAYEYDLNNSGYTAAQWAAINSGITSALVTKLSALPTNTELTTALGILTNGIEIINEKIPSAASISNKMVDTSAMETYIAQVLDVIDASYNITTADGHVTIQITQVNGKINSFTVTTNDIASADALSFIAGRVATAEENISSLGGRMNTAEDNISSLGGRVSTNETDIAQLQAAYEALTESEPVIIQPTDTWPVANPSTDVIYRVVDRVNTPPQYYTDYMWNGTTMVEMAQYDNAIDDEPTPGSNNLVKSGGVAANIVYDISAANATGGTLATYADIAAALGTNGANVPASIRRGGMSIKFVCSSDNKYIQARCMADEFTTDTTQWSIADEGVLVENPEFVYIKTDANNKILWAIKTDGGIYYGAGVPQQVIDYIEEKIAALSLDEYEDIVAFLNDLEKGDKTLQTLLDEKVDKEEGKSLIDEEYAEGVHYIENPEFVTAYLDSNRKILFGVKKDGNFVFGYGVPQQVRDYVEKEVTEIIRIKVDKEEGKSLIDAEYAEGVSQIENPEFIELHFDAEYKILYGVKKDGDFYFGAGIPSQVQEKISEDAANKVDKEEGKSLIDAEYASSQKVIDNPEYDFVFTDSVGRIVFSIRKDGSVDNNVEKYVTLALNLEWTLHQFYSNTGQWVRQENQMWGYSNPVEVFAGDILEITTKGTPTSSLFARARNDGSGVYSLKGADTQLEPLFVAPDMELRTYNYTVDKHCYIVISAYLGNENPILYIKRSKNKDEQIATINDWNSTQYAEHKHFYVDEKCFVPNFTKKHLNGILTYEGDTKSTENYIVNAVAYPNGEIIACRKGGAVVKILNNGQETPIQYNDADMIIANATDCRGVFMDSECNVLISPHSDVGRGGIGYMSQSDRGIYRIPSGSNIATKVLNLYNVAEVAPKRVILWQTNTAYTVGEVVWYINRCYYCKENHTSGSSFDYSKFELPPKFTSNTQYSVGDIVSVNNNDFECIVAYTSGVSFDKYVQEHWVDAATTISGEYDTIWTFCEDDKGCIYAGVYAQNQRRMPVIYKSDDNGLHWIYLFNFATNAGVDMLPSWSIVQGPRHIHGITFNDYDNCLYVALGETNTVWKSADYGYTWKDLHCAGYHGKPTSVIGVPDGIIIGSDGRWECGLTKICTDGKTAKLVGQIWASFIFFIRRSDLTGWIYAFSLTDTVNGSKGIGRPCPPVEAMTDSSVLEEWKESVTYSELTDWEVNNNFCKKYYPEDAVVPHHAAIMVSKDNGDTWEIIRYEEVGTNSTTGFIPIGYFRNGECLCGLTKQYGNSNIYVNPIIISEGKKKMTPEGYDLTGEIFIKTNNSNIVNY